MKLRSRFSPLSLALRLCAIVVPFILPNWMIGPVPVRAKSLSPVLDQRREPGENSSFQACGSNLRFLLDSICYSENRGGYYNPTPRTIPATYRHGAAGGQNLGFQLLRQRQHTPGEIPVRALREAPITDECCRKPCDRTELLKYCASSNERTYRNDIRAHYNPATVPTPTTTTTTTAATPPRIEIQENDEVAFIPCLVQTLWGLTGTRSKDQLSCQRMLIKTLNGDQEDVTLTMSNTNRNRNSDPRLITNSQTRPLSEEPTLMAVTGTGRRHNNGRNIIERDVHSVAQPRHRIQLQNPYFASRSRPRHTPTKSSDEIGIDENSSQDHSMSSSSNSEISGSSSRRQEMKLESAEDMIVVSPIVSLAEVFMDDVRSSEVFAIPAETNSLSLRRNFHGD